MKLVINGQEKNLSGPLSLTELLLQLELDPQRLAVELNQQVILRDAIGAVDLKDGDQLELVQFVGGG